MSDFENKPVNSDRASFSPGAEDYAKIQVEVSNTQSSLVVEQESIGSMIRRVLHFEGIPRAQISLALVDDATIRRINQRHLNHDWPTDVISFSLSEPDESLLIGELVVSAEMARNTAVEYQTDAHSELALYIVHGLLHLCGYDDGEPEDIRRMREREDEVLRREGIRNAYRLGPRHEVQQQGRESKTCSA